MHEKPFKALGELVAGDAYLYQEGRGGDSKVGLRFGALLRWGLEGRPAGAGHGRGGRPCLSRDCKSTAMRPAPRPGAPAGAR
jgi:hypothetical protein